MKVLHLALCSTAAGLMLGVAGAASAGVESTVHVPAKPSATATPEAKPAADEVLAENEYLRVRLSASQGGIVSIYDKRAGRELAARVDSQPAFQIEVSEPAKGAEKLTITSRQAAASSASELQEGKTKILCLEFSQLGARPIAATCRFALTPGDRYLRCGFEARLGPGLALESVRFPIVTLRTPAGAQADDALVFGRTKGGVYRQPSAWRKNRSVTFTQPGTLAAAFACYYDAAGGLATAAFDARGFRKSVTASRTPDGLALAWLQPCFQREAFRQEFELALTPFGSPDPGRAADWRDAADLYKAWAVRQPWCARTFGQRDDLPAWIKQGPAMVRFGREWLAHPERIEAWLRDSWKPEFHAPRVPLIIAYWGWEKHGSWVTPDYYPVFPSDEQFARLAALGRSLNGHAFLWPSGYHYTLMYDKRADGSFEWDDRERFFREAAPHAVHGRDGKLLAAERSWLRGGQTATMCPGDPWTIDWFNRLAVEAVRRGSELVQVDQVVGGNFPACYRADHGHAPGPGLWCTEVFRRQLASMLAACRAIDPEMVACFEEPNEWFIQQVGIQDYRDWEVMRRDDAEPASVFNYLYHEYLPTFQSNPTRGDVWQTAYCCVNGQIPHMVPSQAGLALADGGFEEFSKPSSGGWSKVNAYGGKAYAGQADGDASVRHSGAASLRLTNGEHDIVQVSQNVQVSDDFAAGRRYRLSAWIKTAELARPNAIGLAALARGLKGAGSWRIPLPPPGDWTRGEATFTLPETAEMLRIMIHVNGRAKLWVDDVRLEELLPDGRAVEVQLPRFPREHRLVRQWVELYHGRGRPWLHLGRILHPPRLECESVELSGRMFPAVLHNAYAASDGSEAVVLANPTTEARAAVLTWRGRQIELKLAPQEVRLLTGDEGSPKRQVRAG